MNPSAPHDQATTKASLKAWWKQWSFTQRAKKEHEDKHGQRTPCAPAPALTPRPGSRVFGVPLRESLKYASVHISTANAGGQLYIWGYVPVVVAKWSARSLPHLAIALILPSFLLPRPVACI